MTTAVYEVWGIALPLFLLIWADAFLFLYVVWIAYKTESRHAKHLRRQEGVAHDTRKDHHDQAKETQA